LFEAAELGSQIEKQEFQAEVPGLRVDLVNLQYELREAPFPVLIVLVGDDREEQARRFAAREQTPYKKYKISSEDYRNRDQRPEYERAINEMLARTSTDLAPWRLVPANDKRFARIDVIRAVCDGLERMLGDEE